MRNLSFSETTEQVLRREKTVTRRFGPLYSSFRLRPRPGDLLCAVERGQGLRRGESVRRLAVIVVVSVRMESLDRLIEQPEYGAAEMRLEGFPGLSPDEFVAMFRSMHRGAMMPWDVVARVEFRYVPGGALRDV